MKIALVDFETRKVATPAGTTHANGEPLKTRWQIFAAGVAIDGEITILYGDDETKLLAEIGALLEGATEVGYFATREFDEMVARGRFTNARRAHAPAPYYPAIPGAESLPWRNLRRSGERFPERPGTQVASKDVPAAWKAGRRAEVLDHLRWDVETLVALRAGR
jgi:hypothetical protein